MAKTIAQAEAELRAAALEYVAAHKRYVDAFDRHGDYKRYAHSSDGKADPEIPLHPETEALCRESNAAEQKMCDAASALAAAVEAERRAEAL